MIRNTISHFLKKQHELYPSYVGTDAFDLDKYRRVMYEPYREEIRKEDAAKGKKTEELVLSQNLKLSAEAGNTGIDGIGTALILVFAVWTAALTVFLVAMLPQLQMLMVAVLRMMKKLRAILTTG